MRLLTLFLILLLTILLYTLFFGKNGIVDYRAVSEDIAVQESVNQSLRDRNALIFAEIDDLSQGLDAIEEKARNELGLIKEDETFYRIIGDNSEENATFNSDQ